MLFQAAYNHFIHLVVRYVFRRRFYKRRIFDYFMWLDLADPGISRTLMLFGERELDHKWLLEAVCKRDMCVLDIGANIGYYVLMESKLIGSGGRIFAVEPSAENYRLLERNLKLNNIDHQVELNQVAVSSETGTKTFYLSNMSNLNTFHVDHVSNEQLQDYHAVDVSTTTVRDIYNRCGRFDLIRMDVEGHEVEILSNALDLIAENLVRPIVIFETHLSRYGPTSKFQQILQDYVHLGYKFRFVSSSSLSGSNELEKRGYRKLTEIKTDEYIRGIFENIDVNDACGMITQIGGIRTVVMTP